MATGLGWYWISRGPGAPVFVTAADQNVLLITIDTLRADALGAYGGRAATPNLDRLASEGVRFTFAHAHAVMTLPSHASIMTGRYPFEHGARDNSGFRVAQSVRTLAEAAREKGFATGAFVGAVPLDRQFGLARGFETYDDLGGQEVAPADFLFAERRAGEVVAAATQWIGRQQKPWVAWVHVFDPHSPYEPPSPFREQYKQDPYAGEVAYTDRELGPLLDLARQSSRPTTVIVTADHGEGLGDHGEATHGIFAYESTLRVPLILAQVGPAEAGFRQPVVTAGFGQPVEAGFSRPGGGFRRPVEAGFSRPGGGLRRPVEAGFSRPGGGGSADAVSTRPSAVIDAPVRHVDILPTIAALTGLQIPTDLPGRTLVSTLNGDREDRPAYFEAMTAMLKRGWAPLRGVIAGREKYIDLPIEELYDLASDSREEQNLAASGRERVRVLAAHLKGLGAALPGEQADENAAVRARLQSLGYLSGSAARKAAYGEEDDPKGLIDVDRLMMEGIDLHRQRRSSEAIATYRRVIARRPDMALAYRRLAYIQWESGTTADAIATLRETLARNGRDVEVEIRLGTYLAEAGQPGEAIPLLERATSAAPENAEGANALGIAYARAGRRDDARRTFERILATDPRNAFALENLGAIHMQGGDWPGARRVFERAVEQSPRSSRAHAGLGAVAVQQDRTDEAIGHWRRAVELDPANFDALFNLASTLIRIGRLDEARPYAVRFIETAPRAFYEKDIERFRQVVGR